MIQLTINNKVKQTLADFGFCGVKSFGLSLVRAENSDFIISFSLMCSFFSQLIGLQVYTLKILFILLLAELVFGIWAGVRRFGKFKVKRLQRFGLKVFIYFLILLVFNTLTLQYENSSGEYYIYSSIHSFVVFYIIAVYIISILENIHYLTGYSSELGDLIKIFKLKIFKASRKITEESETTIDDSDLNVKS